jgi:hypothetical protein
MSKGSDTGKNAALANRFVLRIPTRLIEIDFYNLHELGI